MATHPPAYSASRPFILFTTGATSYELVRYLGSRAGGELLLARRHYARTPGGLVLIKRLRDVTDDVARARLREEVKLLMRLSHPAIAPVYLVRVHDGAPHLVTEYVDGPCLETLSSFAALRRRPFSEAFAAYLGAEVADALHHAHSLEDARGLPVGVVHRDISPRSVRVDVHGRVRLSDFAFAWSRLPGRVVTEPGLVRGDVAYASPEALEGQPLDGRADLFSLGMVLLELLTGLHLLDLDDVERAAQQAQPVPGTRGLCAETPSWLPAPLMAARMACLTQAHVEQATRGLSPGMRAVLQKVLQRDRELRFQTGAQLRDALRGLLTAEGRPYGPPEALREVAEVRTDALVGPAGEAEAGLPLEDDLWDGCDDDGADWT
ncbi:serine/threonine protein kinase [Corallococcus interemptor]|uniref:Serine/threonine protein kinase n=1 Tax=Corallococcus interemptor TaxID=2316720 RepID=A0A3A8QZC4_9BACT|nr:serine/threonine-protein kinase [Corallococcus interemptor]RKH40968.1 serine/threonine protein kinase [Corallococcus sp. AB050B]RKH74126.1 serine/threonine protein kinase [Corallococcus interemptor]